MLRSLYFIFFGLLCLLPCRLVQACACCADRGVWERRQGALPDHERDIIQALNFQPGKFTEATWEENDPRLGLPDYAARLKRQSPTQLILELSAPGEKTPSRILVTLRGNQVESFRADMELKPKLELDPVNPYKEFLFRADFRISGPLRKKLPMEMYRGIFLLRGHGNLCLDKKHFEEWRLSFEHRDAKDAKSTELLARGRVGEE